MYGKIDKTKIKYIHYGSVLIFESALNKHLCSVS